MQFPGNPGHALGFLDTDSLQNVYVIICNILEFVCYDRLCLCVHHVMEQIHQQFVQHPVVAFSHSYLYDIWNFSFVCPQSSEAAFSDAYPQSSCAPDHFQYTVYQVITQAPIVSPAPNPARTIRSPRCSFPCLCSSSRSTGMEAEDRLPTLSRFVGNFSRSA